MRLAAFARPHRARFAGSFALLAGLFLCELALPWVLRTAIDGPIVAAQTERAAAAEGAFDATPYMFQLGGWSLVYLLVVLIAAVVQYSQLRYVTRTGQRVIHDLRTQLFTHVQRMDIAWYDRNPIGALVTRVTSDIENLSELFTSGFVALAFDLVKIFVVLGLLYWVSVPLATVVTALVPLLVITSILFRGGARRAHRVVRAKLSKLNGYLQEVLSGIRVVAMFGRQERVSSRFRQELDSYYRANLKTVLLFALFFPLIGFLTVLVEGSILWTGAGALSNGTLTFGDFLLFWWWVGMLLGPIRELGERYNVLQSAFASAERVFEVLDTKAKVVTADAPTALPEPFRGHVRFENVSFAYGDDEVLRNISFEIAPGKTVALVGATGSGKSTLVQLLLRFYDPLAGRITIDGVDLAQLEPHAWRRHLGVVLQEDFLFSESLEANLTMGRSEVSATSLAHALDVSTAGELIARLPQGLETQVAERGVTLSTGERELFAMARALAGSPRLIVFDEATASVDSATEARIEEATHRLLSGRSALVVAHRLSTVRRADTILVMDRGRLVESGTHDELLASGGLYAKLYELQFSDDTLP
ncbi:MAG: ABC transporter ATP-binding protein [Planctomycetota bacterium]